jgi:hypothetical protein
MDRGPSVDLMTSATACIRTTTVCLTISEFLLLRGVAADRNGAAPLQPKCSHAVLFCQSLVSSVLEKFGIVTFLLKRELGQAVRWSFD